MDGSTRQMWVKPQPLYTFQDRNKDFEVSSIVEFNSVRASVDIKPLSKCLLSLDETSEFYFNTCTYIYILSYQYIFINFLPENVIGSLIFII